MKKSVGSLLVGLVFLASSAHAAIVYTDGAINWDADIGSVDSLLFSTTLTNSSMGDETTALENFLGLASGSLLFNKEDVDDFGISEGGNRWLQYTDVTDGNDYLTFDFGEGSGAEYYFLKLGVGNTDAHTHYYFDNVDDLRYAFISVEEMFGYEGNDTTGYNFNIGRISHVSVPEPAMVSLFGIGLIGLGLARRRQKK